MSLSGATETVQLARAVFTAAAMYGQDPLALARRFGIDPAILADPDGRIDGELAVRIWDEVPRICGDDLFGLRVAEQASVSIMPVLGYMLRASATLGEGLRRSLAYQRLMQDVHLAELEIAGREARIIVPAQHEKERLRHATDFALGLMVKLARDITGLPFVPIRVLLPRSRPSDAGAYGNLFGGDVRFGAQMPELVFDAAALDLPVVTADPHLFDLLERHARAMLERIPDRTRLTARARAAIVELLRGGAPSVEDVARALRISGRTLQRRLHGEGTAVAELVDEVRGDLARRYLTDPTIAIAEVALLLGFAEQATFHRAFVRWHGEPPGAWRRKQNELARAARA